MSFSDMMQSGRGPGVIGLLLALVVLCGFGGLSILALNEQPSAQQPTIQAVLREQTKEIDDLATAIAQKQQGLDVIPTLQEAEAKLRAARQEILDAEKQLESTQNSLAEGQQQFAAKVAEFEQYKDQYRQFVRNGAKDQAIAKLQTRSGKVYENVVIIEVTPVGMRIRYQNDGIARVPCEELPAELQDRFQFDPTQKNAAIAKENAGRKAYESAASNTLTATKQQEEERKKAEASAGKLDAQRAIAAKTAQITALNAEIIRLESELQSDKNKKFKGNIDAKTDRIADKKKQLIQLQAEVAQLRDRI